MRRDPRNCLGADTQAAVMAGIGVNDQEYDVLLEGIHDALQHRGDSEQLRDIRNTLDASAFIPGLKAHIALRKANQPGAVEDQIRALRRLAEELEGSLDTDSKVTLGLGGSIAAGLVVGGVLLVATPPLALIFAGAGILTAGVSYFGVRKIDGEKLLCHQIADALRDIEKALQ